jgi:hypothetical protein
VARAGKRIKEKRIKEKRIEIKLESFAASMKR